MKKFDFKSILLGFVIGSLGITTAFAAGGIKSATFNSSKVYFYGQEVPLKSQLVSVVKDGETKAEVYAPMKELLEYMNFIVEQSADGKKINLTMKGSGSGSYGYDASKLSKSEADKKGIAIMDKTGTWNQEIDRLIPHMTPAGVEKVVTIYLDRHLFPGVTTPQGAKQVASTIAPAMEYMTEDARKSVNKRIAGFY